MTRIPVALIATAMLVAGVAQAGERYGSDRERYVSHDQPRYDLAEVVRVEPIIEIVSEPVYSQHCYEQPVYETVYEQDYYGDYYGSGHVGGHGERVLGAIAGGLLGNQFGHGGGRVAATFFGTVLGDALVADHQQRHAGNDSAYRGRYPVGERISYRERCDTHTRYVNEERVRSFAVTYRYQGALYHARTAFDPGDSLRVRVDVLPAD